MKKRIKEVINEDKNWPLCLVDIESGRLIIFIFYGACLTSQR